MNKKKEQREKDFGSHCKCLISNFFYFINGETTIERYFSKD